MFSILINTMINNKKNTIFKIYFLCILCKQKCADVKYTLCRCKLYTPVKRFTTDNSWAFTVFKKHSKNTCYL